MDSRVHGAVARGAGLTTASALHDLGIDPRLVRRWLRQGLLVRVWWGVYTTGEVWADWDEFRDRPRARIRAAEHTLRIPHAFSHDSAALLQGVPLISPRRAAVHVTRRHLRGSRTISSIHHHGGRYQPDQLVEIDGLPALDVPRTVADLAREHGYRAGLVAADGAMQLGVRRHELEAAARPMTGWPHSRVVRQVISDADPGAESVLETLGRELLVECGLDVSETQFPVVTSSGVAWCDLRVGCHVVECDGRTKSRPREAGGLAGRDLEQVLWDERRRQREVCGAGLGMSRLVWADMWGEARTHAKQRVLQEEAVTRARFGSILPPHLEETARRLRGQRYRTAG